MNGNSHGSNGGEYGLEDGPTGPALEALRKPQRRRIVVLLAEDSPRDVSELLPDQFPDVDSSERYRTMLYHLHLPKLADLGYVEWAPHSGTVRRGPRFDEVRALVDLLQDSQNGSRADLA